MSNNSNQNTTATTFANAIGGGTGNVCNFGNSTAADGDMNGNSSSTTAATAPATTVSNSNSNGVWSGLRTSLFSTAALIADEHGDPLAATQ